MAGATTTATKQQLLLAEARQLVSELHAGHITPSAYDTAWVARIPTFVNHRRPRFEQSLEWVKANQLDDGSWGAAGIEYFHDRIISTLSCMITLKEWDTAATQVRWGEDYINRNLVNLAQDHHETIGFELLLPSLLEKARSLGLRINMDHPIVGRYHVLREKKLKKLPPAFLYQSPTTVGHSIEFMETLRDIDVDALKIQQGINGAFGNSPAATSFYFLRAQDPYALEYLNMLGDIFEWAYPSIYPFEIFEKAWVIYNFQLAGMDLNAALQQDLDYLWALWNPEYGVGIGQTFLLPDLDDASLVFRVLRYNNYDASPDFIHYYEREGGYVTFPYELNPSVSTYAHLLGALNSLNYEMDHPLVQTVLAFLRGRQLDEGFWFDKWQISPYYTTCHLVIELALLGEDDMRDQALAWLLNSQKPDGSWGFYFDGTVEETAYAMQALLFNGNSEHSTLDRAYQYLNRWSAQDNLVVPSQWIDKGLYTPINVVKSAVLSAQYMYLEYKHKG
jgi:halimadienyl-diphosphate synthase